MNSTTVPLRGRPRDPDIDRRVLDAARRELAVSGYEAMSVSAIAQRAGTTRQALYRRWASKADLATAAIADMAQASYPAFTDDAYEDLVRELESFRRGISRPDGMSMVGTMLLSSTDPDLVALYRERVVAPRRARLCSILERARAQGQIHCDADVEGLVNMLTGSWYARALAESRPLPRWARRTAALAWRALGGVPA